MTDTWYDAIPEAERKGAEKFKTPADLWKAYQGLEAYQGRSLAVPADDAKDED